MVLLTTNIAPLELFRGDLSIDGFFHSRKFSVLKIVAFEKRSHPGATPAGFTAFGGKNHGGTHSLLKGEIKARF